MTPVVAAAVLLAAFTHAAWNALAHAIKDQLTAFTLISGGAAVIGAGIACFTGLPAAAAWPYLLVSAALHVGYQLLLMRSFSLGDFGQMYPIARGTAPLVVTVLAAVLLGERLDRWQGPGSRWPAPGWWGSPSGASAAPAGGPTGPRSPPPWRRGWPSPPTPSSTGPGYGPPGAPSGISPG